MISIFSIAHPVLRLLGIFFCSVSMHHALKLMLAGRTLGLSVQAFVTGAVTGCTELVMPVLPPVRNLHATMDDEARRQAELSDRQLLGMQWRAEQQAAHKSSMMVC